MKFKERTLMQLADMICGNIKDDEPSYFQYRSSGYLSEFFRDCDTEYRHDGSTRNYWVAGVLGKILSEPTGSHATPPETFLRVIQLLMDRTDAHNEDANRTNALKKLNLVLSREGYEAFYAEDQLCYLRHIATNKVCNSTTNPHRPFSSTEIAKREQLSSYLDTMSEDDLIEEILLPLFRQLGFHRITASGHKDKALEYGKDIWMKFLLPTQHVLYFGIQVKKGKLDSSGVSKTSSANVAEVFNQVSMMIGHEVFDPEIGKRVLVDHAFIVSGGEITKAARNWLGNKLDASKRSQILFMDREDILNLFIVTNLPLPSRALPKVILDAQDDEIPF